MRLLQQSFTNTSSTGWIARCWVPFCKNQRRQSLLIGKHVNCWSRPRNSDRKNPLPRIPRQCFQEYWPRSLARIGARVGNHQNYGRLQQVAGQRAWEGCGRSNIHAIYKFSSWVSCTTVEYIPALHPVSNILWDVVDVTYGLSACNAQPSNRSQNLSCQLFGLGLDVILKNHVQASKGMKKQTSALVSHKTLAQTWSQKARKAGSCCLPQSNILMKSKNFDTSSSSKHSRKGRNVFKTITWAELHQRFSNAYRNPLQSNALKTPLKPFSLAESSFPTKWHRESPEHRHLLKQGDPKNASPMATAGASQRPTWTRHRETSSWELVPTSHTSMGWTEHEFLKIKQKEHFGNEFCSHANQQLREAEVHSPKVIMQFRHTVFHAAQGCTAVGQHQWQPFNVQAWTEKDPIPFSTNDVNQNPNWAEIYLPTPAWEGKNLHKDQESRVCSRYIFKNKQ